MGLNELSNHFVGDNFEGFPSFFSGWTDFLFWEKETVGEHGALRSQLDQISVWNVESTLGVIVRSSGSFVWKDTYISTIVLYKLEAIEGILTHQVSSSSDSVFRSVKLVQSLGCSQRQRSQSSGVILRIRPLSVSVRDQPKLGIRVERDESLNRILFQELFNCSGFRFTEGRGTMVGFVARVRRGSRRSEEPVKVSVQVDSRTTDGVEVVLLTLCRSSVLSPHSVLGVTVVVAIRIHDRKDVPIDIVQEVLDFWIFFVVANEFVQSDQSGGWGDPFSGMDSGVEPDRNFFGSQTSVSADLHNEDRSVFVSSSDLDQSDQIWVLISELVQMFFDSIPSVVLVQSEFRGIMHIIGI